MRVLVIGNFSDLRCGFANFSQQTVIALQRAGLDVTAFDGTYPKVYFRHQIDIEAFFPPDVGDYDIVHLVWNAMTMNHYSGADWAKCHHTSWWDGGPSDASCPFKDAMQIRWSEYGQPDHHQLWYPVPDWVQVLPQPASMFTVGMSTVRGDGAPVVKDSCDRHGWVFNGPNSSWLSIDEEVQRLARSSVNVCWYHTSPIWKNRASAPSMLLASGRPLLINRDSILAHLWDAQDVYHADDDTLESTLTTLASQWIEHPLMQPIDTREALSWTAAAQEMIRVWEEALR